jgi:hypothetical protein
MSDTTRPAEDAPVCPSGDPNKLPPGSLVLSVPSGTLLPSLEAVKAASAIWDRMRDRTTPARRRVDHWWDTFATCTSRRSEVNGHAEAVEFWLGESVVHLSYAINDAGLYDTVQALPHSDLVGHSLAVPFLQRAVTAARYGVVRPELIRGTLSKMLVELLADSTAVRVLTCELRREVAGDYGFTNEDQLELARSGILPPPSIEPAPVQTTEDTPTKRQTKGKDIDAKMLKVMTEKQESWAWSARQWADHLGCSDGTIKGTKTWRERLPAVRALIAVTSAEKMVGRRSAGGKKPAHRSQW